MADLSTLQSLLTQAMLIAARYQSQKITTGEEFNIFRILDVQSAEVRTHSAFLAELLNPAGSHGLKTTFLDLFVQQFGITDFETASAIVEVEKHIGAIREDYSAGGRIDICISPRVGRPIFIENKIYAGDQKQQLLRYHNHDARAKLFYLTLDGSKPTDYTTGAKVAPDSLQILSYASDIIAWLEACRKEATMHPIVRGTITQYIHLLKSLTGQTTNKLMLEEVKKLILQSPQALASAQSFGDAFTQIRGQVHRELVADFTNAFQVLLPSSADQVFMTYQGYQIKFAYDSDSNGYFWGFPAYDQAGNGGVCKRKEFDEFAAFLRTLNSEFKRSDWWAGWINPPGFTKVENCSAQKLFELTNPAARQELATKTAQEALYCMNQLIQKFGGAVTS